MPNAKKHFVGIDVAKDWLDVAVLGEKRTKQFANTKKGIRDLVRWMSQLEPERIVVEATGGYEEALVLTLFEAGLRVALESPQRVRQYARAKGRLAKTDPLDAQLLAEYGKAIQPRLFVGKSEERKQLSALVGRRLSQVACPPDSPSSRPSICLGVFHLTINTLRVSVEKGFS